MFAFSLILGSRSFLGFAMSRRGWFDASLSLLTMYLVLLVMRHLCSGRMRTGITLAAGIWLILFHLVFGIHVRFYKSTPPPDLFLAYRDLPAIAGEALMLMDGTNWLLAVMMPLGMLAFLCVCPGAERRGGILIALCVPAVLGWGYRIARPLPIHMRTPLRMSALPQAVADTCFLYVQLRLDEDRFLEASQSVRRHASGAGVRARAREIAEGAPSSSFSPDRPGGGGPYNVILILLESFRSYECGFLGAAESFTPALDALSGRARVFPNFYANGMGTARSEFCCLTSIYPNPAGAPVYYVRPALHVPALPGILQTHGYRTLWFSAYRADFNRKSRFLRRHGVHAIYDSDTLPQQKGDDIAGGRSDEELFENVWDIIRNTAQPFFAQVTTLSNHWSLDTVFPTDDRVPDVSGSKEYRHYVRGLYYTDFAAGKFLNRILHSDLMRNTIVVLTGDHGLPLMPPDIHGALQWWEICFRVPLCIWGPGDVVRQGTDVVVGSHLDIAPTILDLLDAGHPVPPSTFLGRSLLATTPADAGRFALMFLGRHAYYRTQSLYYLTGTPDTDRIPPASMTDPDVPLVCGAISGDPLRGIHQISEIADKTTREDVQGDVEDIRTYTAYGIYFDAFAREKRQGF